jgi:hypothetical protein
MGNSLCLYDERDQKQPGWNKILRLEIPLTSAYSASGAECKTPCCAPYICPDGDIGTAGIGFGGAGVTFFSKSAW